MPDTISTPGAPHELRRTLGLWSAVAVVIGSTIGSGIFRSPAGIAAKLPGPLPMLCVWAAGGLFAVCGALTLAEIASAIPNTGGMYVFCRDGWGRLAGFLFGWGQFAMIRAASLGAISIVFSEYFFRVAGIDPQDPANLWAVRWNSPGYYRPQLQSHEELYIDTQWLQRFPSKHFRLVAGIAHEYRQDVMFPTSNTFESLSDANGIVALFSHELIGRIEFHILDCTIFFNSYSGISPTHVEEVRGYLLPPQRLEYGVRWAFWN